MRKMPELCVRRQALLASLVCLVLGLCARAGAFAADNEPTRLRLATTTSTQASGLLDYILPPFEKLENIKVDVIAVGTGKAIVLGENGDVDVVLAHAPQAEEDFVWAGHGLKRWLVMHNDFIIVGPASDPAAIKGLKDALKVVERVAGHPFISRGDESGTHIKERELWQTAGIQPTGAWYMPTGQGMSETLMVADEKQAYCLTDRATYLAYASKLDLAILCQGDKRLMNYYSIIAVNPAKHPYVKIAAATKFIKYLVGKYGQGRIAGFRINGKQVFFPDAMPHVKPILATAAPAGTP